MSHIQILTDSACDLPKELIETLGITVVPLYVTFEDGTIVRDGIDIDGDGFYSKMKSCKKLPTTSQPSPDAFLTAFDRAKEQGNEMIAILLSSTLSGTFQSAQIAANIIGYEGIHLVDSGSLCLSMGILVQLATTLANKGKPVPEILETLERAKEHLHIFAVIDNLDYLRKGGRLPASVAIAGGLLGIKPLITIQDGKVSLCGKARGLPGAYVTLFKKIETVGGICPDAPYYAGYTANIHEIDPIQRYLTQNLNLAPASVGRVGSAIGVHAGPGAFGVAFLDNGFTLS